MIGLLFPFFFINKHHCLCSPIVPHNLAAAKQHLSHIMHHKYMITAAQIWMEEKTIPKKWRDSPKASFKCTLHHTHHRVGTPIPPILPAPIPYRPKSA